MSNEKGLRMEPFTFAESSALKVPVSVKINNLEGQQQPIPYSTLVQNPVEQHRGSNTDPNFELYVTAQLWADSKPLDVPVLTSYKHFKAGRAWNQWLNFSIPYSSVPRNAQVAITVWDLQPTDEGTSRFGTIPFGGTTIPLFDNNDTLFKGRQRCMLHRHKAADGFSDTTTPWVLPPKRGRKASRAEENTADGKVAEMNRLTALFKKHEMGEIAKEKWLDLMVFKKMEKLEDSIIKDSARRLREMNGKSEGTSKGNSDGNESDTDVKEEEFYLNVEFPRFDHPIVFTDTEYPAPPISTMLHAPGSTSEIRLKPPPEVSFGPGINVEGEAYGDEDSGRLIRIYDPEVGMRDNPVEAKHRRMVRTHRTGLADRDLKPNPKHRDELNHILTYGPEHELRDGERDLVWKFRHHLTREKRALTKFVKSVSWSDQNEARLAVQILPKWTQIDVDDALELLGPTYRNPDVRAYAVDRLRKADDEELLLYLLQLVQALKYERISTNSDEGNSNDSSLARFLITRAANNLILGTYLNWYLLVEIDDFSPEQGQEHRKLFAKVEYDFMVEVESQPDGKERRKTLLRQAEFITILSKISLEVRNAREDRTRKITRLRKFLADPQNELLEIDPPLPLPLDPSVQITGCYPNESTVFKSTLSPMKIEFRTTAGGRYALIFKTGDDLRQDQLVIQIITLMDRLLRKENLDLKLTPYRILATSTSAGAVQYINSVPISQAAGAKYKGSLLNYLRDNNPDGTAPLGIRKEAMDTYVRSCAGYCVITYLLGVGDRHLDNLLLAPDGHFFHADFGYILGRDPKPFAPLMKLSKEMVDGMGGTNSPHYQSFRQYCFTAYTTLRKSSNLILNLFALMREANIPDIRNEPDKAVWKVRERMMLELSEGEAGRHFEGLMADSLGAMMPVVIDRMHAFVQHWRA